MLVPRCPLQRFHCISFSEKDFSSGTQVKTVVPPGSGASQEVYFNVPLHDDNIEEDDEYFLLLLDVHDSDVIEYDENRQCVRLTIITDEDSKQLIYWATQNQN